MAFPTAFPAGVAWLLVAEVGLVAGVETLEAPCVCLCVAHTNPKGPTRLTLGLQPEVIQPGSERLSSEVRLELFLG